LLSSAGSIAVELEQVTFCYPGTSEPSLKDLSLSIPAGALVAVTGPVGSGKSALARVLLNLYPLDAGVIRFNGHDARIGYLPQEPFLFSGTVRENILFGADGLEVKPENLTAAALSEDLRGFPAGLETQIGELGIRVSGGQRQRIALARALAAFAPDAPGLLVLDDPFSAVDVNTEAQMIAALHESFGPQAPRHQQATIILCSHRLAAFPQADLIVVLDEGRIREQGNHAELMRVGGLYSRIFTAQQKAEGQQ
jgi:ABC-type multidrug transport system fused ATPase/permease subunit